MNKLLAYGLWMLLSLSSASAIWCHKCEKPSDMEKCRKRQQTCWAGEGESCYTQNLYIRKALMFSRVGCFKGCTDFKEPAPFLWFTFTCCNKNFCNE